MTRYEVFVHQDEYEVMETTMKRITMLAHQYVLFEKIKQKINEQEGERLEKIAEIVVNNSKSYIEPESDLDRGTEDSEDDLMGSEEE